MDPLARAGSATLGFALAGVAALLFTLRHVPVVNDDALLYHLPLATWWLQAGWLSPVDLPFHGGGIEHGPALSQTLVLLLLRLTGDDGLVWLLQPACLVAVALVFHRSARLVGAGRPLAAGLAGLLLFCPPLFVNATLQDNDLLLLLGVALALHGLLLLRRRPRPGVVVLGLGLGLALATKGTATVLALALLPFAAAGLARARRDRRLAGAAALGGALLLLGAGFLLRAWALHGNPLWPGQVRVLGLTLFDGPYDLSGFLEGAGSPAALAALLLDGPEQHALVPPWSALLWAGWLLAAATTVCAGMGAPALRPDGRASAPLRSATTVRARGWRRAGLRAAVPVLFPLLACALLLGLVPGAWEEPRYLLPVVYGLWLALALGLARLARLRRRLAPWLALAAPAFLLVKLVVDGAWHQAWVPAALLGAALAVALDLAPPAARRRAPWVALGLVALAALAGPLWYPAHRAARDAARDPARERLRGDLGDLSRAWTLLDALTRDRPRVVAYAGTGLVQPLFGPRLANRVVYARLSPADRPDDRLTFERPPRPPGIHLMPLRVAQRRRRHVDDDFWLRELERERVALLLLSEVEPLRGGVAPELGLVRRHPRRFRTVFQGRGVWLLEVLPG